MPKEAYRQREIKIFDKYGRGYVIPLEKWRLELLPKAIQEGWSNPEALSQLIVQGIKEGLYKDLLPCAQRLLEIDPEEERATCLACLILTEVGKVNEAKRMLNKYIKTKPQSASILMSLAKIHASEGDIGAAYQLSTEALAIEPNEEGALQLYWQFRILEGKQALLEVSKLPHSWRAKCYLAKIELENDNPEQAIEYYKEALKDCPKPYPEDLLTMISGELGNAGLLVEALDLTLARFNPDKHDLPVANNIIKLLIDLGKPLEAKKLVKKLWLRDRADWKEALLFWESEAVNLDLETRDPIDAPQIIVSSLEAPIWMKNAKNLKNTHEKEKTESERIAFLTSSATIPEEARKWGLSGACGRYSRALPCYWAEEVSMNTTAKTYSMQVSLEDGTAILMGNEAEDEHYCMYARNNEPVADYIVVSHINTNPKNKKNVKDYELWEIKVKILRTIDCVCLDTLKADFDPSNPKEGINKVTKALITSVLTKTESQPTKKEKNLSNPDPLENYLLRLEQLQSLALHYSMKNKGAEFNGIHEFITGSMDMCLNNPKNAVSRLILVQCFNLAKNIERGIGKQYCQKIEFLNDECPLPKEEMSTIESILHKKG
jgi:tetratricopeptide (TPR) repeat protein